jgi:hypothetical protein
MLNAQMPIYCPFFHNHFVGLTWGIKEQSIAKHSSPCTMNTAGTVKKFARGEHLLCENRISCAEPRTYAHELECW